MILLPQAKAAPLLHRTAVDRRLLPRLLLLRLLPSQNQEQRQKQRELLEVLVKLTGRIKHRQGQLSDVTTPALAARSPHIGTAFFQPEFAIATESITDNVDGAFSLNTTIRRMPLMVCWNGYGSRTTHIKADDARRAFCLLHLHVAVIAFGKHVTHVGLCILWYKKT